MSEEKNEWIQCSERQPTESDYPIVTWSRDGFGRIHKTDPAPSDRWSPHVWWRSIGQPDPKSMVILRHPDGREEEINVPVYTFPSGGTTLPGDEHFNDTGKKIWTPCELNDEPRIEVPGLVRRPLN